MAPQLLQMFRREDDQSDWIDGYDPDANVGPLLMAITGVLTAMIIITTGLRIYVRAMLSILGWDDWTMLFTTCLAIVRMAVQAVQVAHGNGRHHVYIESVEDQQISNMYGWVAQILLFTSVCTLKISIILLILRIKDDRKLKLFLYAVMAGLVITNMGVVVILLAECGSHVEAYWTGQYSKYCWDTKVRIYAIYVTISYSVLTDLLCSLLPIVVVWKVRIPTKTKVAVGSLMSLGLIATGFGIARAASLGISSKDLTWVYAIAAIWSNLELFLGITAANLALSRSIYSYFRYGPEHSQGSKPGSYPSGYLNSNSLRPDHFEPPNTMVGVGRERRASATQSDNSDIPLEPGIQKKTEFWLSEEEGASKRDVSSRGKGN